jgi:hypothetical protein
MKSGLRIILLIIAAISITCCVQIKNATVEKISYVKDLKVQTADTPPSPLKVKGNKIVDEADNTIVLGDIIALEWEGHFTEGYFKKAAAWGARLIRIPVHPGN